MKFKVRVPLFRDKHSLRVVQRAAADIISLRAESPYDHPLYRQGSVIDKTESILEIAVSSVSNVSSI